MFGIKETKEVLDLVRAIPPAVRAQQNGAGFAAYIGPVTMLPAAIGNADQIPDELADLDADEAEELIAEYQDVLNNPEDREIFKHFVRLARAVKDRLQKEETGELEAREISLTVR